MNRLLIRLDEEMREGPRGLAPRKRTKIAGLIRNDKRLASNAPRGRDSRDPERRKAKCRTEMCTRRGK